MDAIRIKNLRVLEDTNFIEIRPITLLLGGNSSGKSTFLRSFPLIRQSVEARTKGPILWYGNLVDFGSFDEAVNSKTKIKEISFTYNLKIPKRPIEDRPITTWHFLYQRLILLEDLNISLELKVIKEPHKDSTICKGCCLSFFDHKVNIELNPNGELAIFKVNENDFSKQKKKLKNEQIGGLIPQIFEVNPDSNIDNRSDYYFFARKIYRSSDLFENLMSALGKLVNHNTSNERINALSLSLGIGSSESMLFAIKNSSKGGKKWKRKVEEWDIENKDYKYLRDVIIANAVFNILSVLDDYISSFARNINYIGPVRATAERYYRSQDLAVREVDSQGKNLAMFIRNLTETERKNFADWTEKNFGFSTYIHTSGGHVSLTIKEKKFSRETNLADMGFGFSQVLPVLTQLWWLSRLNRKSNRHISYPITFAIEQPELHLHPRLQALLADSFIAAVKAAKESGVDLKLVIETHSAVLVNRFGHRIANNDFDSKDINVVIFNKKEADESASTRIASYDEKGFLNNWPLGFFEPDMI